MRSRRPHGDLRRLQRAMREARLFIGDIQTAIERDGLPALLNPPEAQLAAARAAEPATTESEAMAGLFPDAPIEVAPLSVDVVADLGADFRSRTLKENAKAVMTLARERFAGKTVVNASDGSSILIPWQGIKHGLSRNASPGAVYAALRLDD